MNTVMTLIIALVVIVVHVWLCHRSPKFWYLGGTIPVSYTHLDVYKRQHTNQANREKELKADGTISSERHAD